MPGLAAYKAINTLDSMIGHRNDQFHAFGGFAARLDDLANYIPARITALLFSMAAFKSPALKIAFRDAKQHRSPNAGWPEAAMAGALSVRLSGPRKYGDVISDEPWLNGDAGDPTSADLKFGMHIYVKGMMVAAIVCAIVALGTL